MSAQQTWVSPDPFDGVARREELAAAGFTYDAIEAQVAARRWRRLNEVVLVLHNGPLSADQRRLAVWLSAVEPAALCGITAAARMGLSGYDDTQAVHVVVKRGARVLPTPGVERVVHESRRFDDADIWFRRRPAYVSLERGVVDAAVWSCHPRDAARLFAAAVQQRLTTPVRLLEELESAGKVRHRHLLRRLAVDLGGGAEALSEVEFRRFCSRHSLPTPRMNVRHDGSGRRRYLDAVLVGPGGRSVCIEIDGGVHLNLTQRWRDTARDNDLLLAGVPTLRFPSVAIYSDDPEALRQIRTALGICQRQPGS